VNILSLDNTALRLDSVPFRISEFLRKNSLSIASKTIEREIRLVGVSAGMTAKQLSKLTINPSELDLEISIKTHGPIRGDKPRQKWFIAPKGGKNPRGHPRVLSWVDNGTRFFSKGHFVTGADAKYVLDVGIKRGVSKFRNEIKKQTESFMEASSLG